MGEKHVEQGFDERKLQAFMSAVLDDLRALDYMIDHECDRDRRASHGR